jgi:hypothetical protein
MSPSFISVNFLTCSLLRRFASLVAEPDARLRFGELRLDREVDFSNIAEAMMVCLGGLTLLFEVVDSDLRVGVSGSENRYPDWGYVS